MSTVTMNISLTDDLKLFVDARIKARSYSSVSEYVRDLIRRDEERVNEDRFKALMKEAMPARNRRASKPTGKGSSKAQASNANR